MDRQRLYQAWLNEYAQLPKADRLCQSRIRVRDLEVRMRALARVRETMYKGFIRRSLEIALGMALGVHKQVLWGLTSSPPGAYPRRVVGGLGYNQGRA